MKRRALLIVPVLLLVVLAFAVTAQIPQAAGLPARVETRLSQYVDSPFAPDGTSVVRVVRARKPWSFTKEMSGRVLGDSVYFQTDHSLIPARSGGPSPLPFPPKELWCALLECPDGSTLGSHTILFVGLHMDIYNGDWLVHEARDPTSPELRRFITMIGCDLPVD